MKKLILITVLLSSWIFNVSAQDYEKVMRENIQKIFSLKDAKEVAGLANVFERIGKAEKDQWLPNYYAAYSYLHAGFLNVTAEEKSNYLDKAQAIMDGLKKTNSDESEVHVLQAFIYQMRITGPSSGYKYSKLSGEELDEAEKLNDKNPRVYSLKGSNAYHTPRFFGGGASKAKPLFEKAAKLFKAASKNTLMPSWGEAYNTEMLKKCNE